MTAGKPGQPGEFVGQCISSAGTLWTWDGDDWLSRVPNVTFAPSPIPDDGLYSKDKSGTGGDARRNDLL